ncbi:putative disease resistance RPP13-like protein 1 [Cornus florida]|uniref:putative disease resistance RPP13-like protein 1 n=1 Tax=Cornus florida TaxID=4283 RepID=UPI0028979F48|nr:putative disease resistance RPP13-like protein 1 [Cornus florida]XP_059638528.1 putative disease resistance RPP13-like protein 1 [Cornus florida]
MEVVGVFLGPIFEVLLDKLASGAVSDYARRERIHHQLKKLEKMLPDIRAVLADAEQKKKADGVKSWMDDLTDLTLDLDDLLDELDTNASRLELEQIMRPESEASSSSTSKKVRKLIPTCFTCFTPPSAPKLRRNMMSKVEEITTRFEDIEDRKNLLNLIMNVGENRPVRGGERPETTSLVVNTHVYGRENEKEAILELLLEEDESASVSVIPIVGMGGIGKTTLAQLVYDDERLKGFFVPKAWVCVSDDFDVFRVTKAILDAVTSETDKSETLNKLQEKLKEQLSGKKFLLVLDDVWTEKYEDWELLQRPFMFGAPGSKIIVTTRHENVALTMSLSPGYPLKELSKDECLSLLAYHALSSQNFDAHPHLKGIGEQIVRKCKGLPLAVKSLAGLLRTKPPRQSEWVDVLDSEIWEQKSNIFPALMLSYRHLPSHLKQCFAYCAILPKDYEVDKDELVLLWMGVGLLPKSTVKKDMEDVGRKYFDDLLSRSFLQQSSDSKSLFVMHDLLNDLALHVAGDICFRLDKLEGDEQIEIPKRARHLSIVRQRFGVLQKFGSLHKGQHLRTFLPLLGLGGVYLANEVLLDLFSKLQCVRVLSLSNYDITELPDSIGELKHLRYLNLSGTSIRRLPESVSNLYNLQTLLLHNCMDLCMLPSNIGNLINLRHLDVTLTGLYLETGRFDGTGMCSGIDRLTNLQTLSHFVVGKHNGPRLKELKNLGLLRGSISITELQNVSDVQDANEAKLRTKQNIEELELAWCERNFNDFQNENLEMNVLGMLQPHKDLKRLKIEFYGGTNFPSWIGDPSFSKMVNLSLVNCPKCKILPPLGQLPNLKELCIQGMTELQKLGVEFCGDRFPPFPSLETLRFGSMPAWDEWDCSISVGKAGKLQFPCLRELEIYGCPKLIRISLLRLPSLRTLFLQQCDEAVLKSIVDVTSLTSLNVTSITGLLHLDEAFVKYLGALESLTFSGCNQLVAFWQNGGRVRQKNNLLHLKSPSVDWCPRLVSFGEELDEGLPCINLQELYINECVNFEMLPNELHGLTSLTSLKIYQCPKLVEFPKTGVPPMLKKLRLWGCNALKSVPDGICGVERLGIFNCSSLRSWPTETLPTALKVLEISDCMNLEYFPEVSETTMMLQQQQDIHTINMSSLQEVQILGWPKVGMLLLGIGGCVNNSNNNFASLRRLWIRSCNVVECLSFSERGLPNLSELLIINCVNLQSFAATTNLILPSLQSLRIEYCEKLESIPEGGVRLSTPKLRLLRITHCSNLTSLPIFDQILQSLASLVIRHCSNLTSLPNFDQILQSLKTIEIYNCPFLDSYLQGIGNGNLPPNLIQFDTGYSRGLKSR